MHKVLDEQRRRAEARLASSEPARARPEMDETSRLLHELQVHQVELEMQNEELRSARNEIEASLQRYTELFDFAPVGYVVLDRRGSILETNLEFSRTAGIPRSALRGWSFLTFVDPAQRPALGDFLHKRLQEGPGGPAASLEVVFERQRLPVRLVASAHASATPSVLVAVHDVTASKRAEIAQQESARKDDFMAALSHELRNPLFPIRTSLSLLERVEPGSPRARKAIATIERQVEHLAKIVDDLLDVTRVARGKVELRRERLDLRHLVRDVMEDHRHEFESRRIAFEGHLGIEDLWVDADPTRMVQVVGNLLMNATKFTPAGGRVDVVLGRDTGGGVLTVRDNGAGIAPDVRQRLFHPFTQAPQTLDRTRGGLGLGLAMVKGLVELHGGTVGAASEGIGCGSEFTVRLPLVAAPAKEQAPAAPAASKTPHRVLIIEDNADAADAMRELFSYEGHDIRVAYDGASGLAVAREFHPEIVFCDIGLPGMDGYEVARAMRADPGLTDTYLVALSGYARPEDRQRSADAGFDCHLAKPPPEEALERVLAR